MPDKHFFSTGKIRYGAVGAVLTDADNIATVQNVRFNAEFQEAVVREAAHLNQFVVDSVGYDAEITMSFETMSFEADLMPYLTGATKATAGGASTYSWGKTSKPAPMQLVFIGQATDGKEYQIDLPRAKGRQLPLDFGRTSYVGMNVSVNYRPDPDNFVPATMKIVN